MSVEIRIASQAEVAMLVDWAAAEGWNPGIGDAEAFHRADPGGFLLAQCEGVPAAGLSLVRYGAAYAFLGLYIAAPAFRGRGIGHALWREAIGRAGPRGIGLDGVVAQQDNYRRSGFVYAHANVRYGGRPAVGPADSAELVAVDPANRAAVIAYDRSLNPADRSAFLDAWLTEAGGRRSVVLMSGGAVRGYGTLRPCRAGCKIGPLFADDAAGADLIFRRLARFAGDGPVFLDVPEPNGAAVALAARHGLEPVFETARMYRGVDPELPLGRIFGITTLELG